MRALSAIRLSVMTDETTSPERQREANKRAAEAVGAVIVAEAMDLGVSASKTSPFERPELGAWLGRPEAYDCIVFWRFDRALRRMDDMNALARWAADHHKVLIFAEGPGGRLVLDFRQGVDLVTQLLLQVFAFAAEFEAASIRDRVIGAQAAMRHMPLRWRGSKPAYGYLPAELPAGGWTLTQDPVAVEVIRRMVAAFRAGTSPTAIALDLTADGIPTPADYWRVQRGRESTGGVWTSTTVTNILRNPALIGHKQADGKPVLDAEGAPVLLTSAPIMERAEFDSLALLFSERSRGPKVRKDTRALLLDTARCDTCGGKMYLNVQSSRSGQRPTYKCGSKGNGRACAAPVSLRADWLEAFAEREFLASVGSLAVTRRIEIPGYDPAHEIAELAADMDELRSERPASQAGRNSRQKRLAALDARVAILEAMPAVAPQVRYEETGRTFADTYESADQAGRRRLMTEAGAVVRVKPGRAGGWRTLDESRVHFDLLNEFYANAWADLAAAEQAELIGDMA
ncbi:recombinase family protein [Streptomyces sp. NPDC005071]